MGRHACGFFKRLAMVKGNGNSGGRRKIYVAPSANRKSGCPNRYFSILKENLGERFDVLDADGRPWLSQGWALLRHSFEADVFILSFVETIAFHRLAFVQYLMARLSFLVMRLRGRKMVFIFHNPRPHKGENRMSRSLTKAQLVQSCLVVTHSRDTAEFARELLAGYGCRADKVRYVCHPVAPACPRPVVRSGAVLQSCPVPQSGAARQDNHALQSSFEVSPSSSESVETPSARGDCILIWGNILPYKGVLEFVSSPAVRAAGLKVRIVGRCRDEKLASAIMKAVSECGREGCTEIVFENRSADFEELASLVRRSKFVLFPYLKGSVSGSGVLMDTLAMGGNPVGPAVGAFADLAVEGVCRIYASEEEMIEILKSDGRIDPETLNDFIARNSWHAYAEFLAGNV